MHVRSKGDRLVSVISSFALQLDARVAIPEAYNYPPRSLNIPILEGFRSLDDIEWQLAALTDSYPLHGKFLHHHPLHHHPLHHHPRSSKDDDVATI